MNAPQIFSNPEFGQVRVIEQEGEIFFVAKDVALALGYNDVTNAIKQHCDGVVKHHPTLDSLGRTQNARVIQEPDLYRLIFGSKLEGAKKFQDWVFEEVLPTIRKTGSYSVPEVKKSDAETLIKCAALVADSLALDKGSKILLFGRAYTSAGFPADKLLPDYVDEEVTTSVSVLLKRNSVPMSAAKFNKLLEACGILEKKQRPTSKGGMKGFWSLTEAGRKFGKNLLNPKSLKETQPHYFESTFDDLLREVMS